MLPRRTRAPRRIEIGTGEPTYPVTAQDYYRRIDFKAIDLMLKAIPPSTSQIVQSLNSPFFPPHIGAEPGRAKEESRITCMRMLRTNQSKITRSQPRRSRQCVAQYRFQLAL